MLRPSTIPGTRLADAHLPGKLSFSACSTTVFSSSLFCTMNWARSPTVLLLGVTCRRGRPLLLSSPKVAYSNPKEQEPFCWWSPAEQGIVAVCTCCWLLLAAQRTRGLAHNGHLHKDIRNRATAKPYKQPL